MTRPLTTELIRTRTKTDSLQYVKRFTLCGNDIDDVKLVRQMPNIEVLSLSVNRINTLKDFAHCHKLQELYVRKNSILELSEVQYLADLPDLKVLWLCENPCAGSQYYREYVIAMLPNLENLDKTPITQEERNAASNMNFEQPESRNGAKQSESPLNRPSYKDRVENGDKYNGERNGAPSNYNRYNEASSQAYDDGNNYQRNGNGDVRRPSYRVRIESIQLIYNNLEH